MMATTAQSLTENLANDPVASDCGVFEDGQARLLIMDRGMIRPTQSPNTLAQALVSICLDLAIIRLTIHFVVRKR
jgi:hypothetical protein